MNRTVREKISFPLKFEKRAFCLDFTSMGGTSSATSDCEPTCLRQYRMNSQRIGPKMSLSASKTANAPRLFKKKFNSAEKVKNHPSRARSGI